MCALRDKVRKGYCPKTAQEFADILNEVTQYAKAVGREEECKEILEKLSENVPMEKLGVECQGNHNPTQGYMEKQASGDLRCRFCGQTFTAVHIHEKLSMTDQAKKAKTDAKGAVEKMLGQ